MSILIPMDDNGHPIQLLGFDYRGRITVELKTRESVRNSKPIPSDIEVVTLWSSVPCFFELGDESVTADKEFSPFLAPNYYLDVPLKKADRYVAFIPLEESWHEKAFIMGRI